MRALKTKKGNIMAEKLQSRKFWIAVAAFLASVGGSIAGFAIDNQVIVGIGITSTVVSAAIYAAAEAYVDAANVKSSTVSITASTTAKDVVEKVLSGGTDTSDAEE